MYEQEPALYSPEEPGGGGDVFISTQELEEAQGINTHTHTHTSVEALLAGLRAAGREAGKTPTKEPAASCMN